MIYFPGLHGLRAVAAIAVIISHITVSLNQFGLNPSLFGTFDDGTPRGLYLAHYGVTIFFVLSGFLIAYLLQMEKMGVNGHIDIPAFYERRIRRIWPLYYLYVFLALLATIALGQTWSANILYCYLFLAGNVPFIISNTIPLLAHYWSLGVEEQFYAWWPWLHQYDKNLIKVLVVLILFLVGIKLGLHVLYPNSILEAALHVTRFHCLLLGAWGALLYHQRRQWLLNALNNKLVQGLCWMAIGLAAINRFHIASVIDDELMSIVALGLIIGQIEVKNRLINLENKTLVGLGRISYGLYIWHPLLISGLAVLLPWLAVPEMWQYLIVYTSIPLATWGLAYVSYHGFERHFLKKQAY
jgi:peptidoglycan/LPS O-acetylase OafA/YrhL